MRLRGAPLVLTLAFASLLPRASLAQTTVTYHLHNEASTINAARHTPDRL
jgi:hypothetical protein